MSVVLRITGFSGELPSVEPELLPDNKAQLAANVYLTNGEIRPIYKPKKIEQQIAPNTKSVFKAIYNSQEYWFTWSEIVQAVKIAHNNGDERIVFASESFEPRITQASLATSTAPYPSAWYVLGVAPPVTPPTVTVSGGSGTMESRAYCYTFVTQWGEESAPSPVSAIVNNYVNGTWSLTGMNAPPPNTYTISGYSWSGGRLTLNCSNTFGLRVGEYVVLSGFTPAWLNGTHKVIDIVANVNLKIAVDNPGTVTIGTVTRAAPHNTTGMKKRIYRSVTTASNADYYFCIEIPATVTAADDGVCSIAGYYTRAACLGAGGTWTNTISVGEPLMTKDWAQPPTDMHHIAILPFGSVVGVTKDKVCFSEPNAPYAWPEKYKIDINYECVGVAAFESSVVVLTKGEPFLLTGTSPESMSSIQIKQPWPCLEKRGIVAVANGVLYPTTNGVAFINSSTIKLVTAGLFDQLEWNKYYTNQFVACNYDNKYVFYYNKAPTDYGLMFIDYDSGVVSRAYVNATALYQDYADGDLMFVSAEDNNLYRWNAFEVRDIFDWWSKVFYIDSPVNFGAAKLNCKFLMSAAEFATAQMEYNSVVNYNNNLLNTLGTKGSLNSTALNTLTFNGSLLRPLPKLNYETLSFSLYVNGELFFTKEITPTTGAFRLPAGRKYDSVSVRLMGNVPVRRVLLAESMISLRNS